jgi:hypothetical protein
MILWVICKYEIICVGACHSCVTSPIPCTLHSNRNDQTQCTGKALGLYSGNALFESRPGRRISWLKYFVIFFRLHWNSGTVRTRRHVCYLANIFQLFVNQSNPIIRHSMVSIRQLKGHAAEALCYKPEGRRFESRWGHWIFFSWPNPSSRTMALGSTQPLTEMSTGN